MTVQFFKSVLVQNISETEKKPWSFAEQWCGHVQKAGHLAGVQWQQVLLFLNGICVSRPD